MVNRGSIISSIEYRSENDGIAINTRIRAGIIVHTISRTEACIRRYEVAFLSVV
jgi:hypothetical protein